MRRLTRHLLGSLWLVAGCATAALADTAAGPVRISSDTQVAQAADVAIDEQGAIHVMWLGENTAAPNAEQIARRGHSHDSSTNLYYTRSVDGGASFEAPRTLNASEGDVWGFAISKPRVAIGQDDSVHVLYPGNAFNQKTGQSETTAMYVRSADRGASFDTPRRLNVDALTDALDKDDGGSFAALATDRAGSVYAMWVDTREMDLDDYGRVFLSASRDDGVRFSRDHEVFAAEICPCCQLQLLVDDRSRLVVGLRDVEGPYRDNAIAVSTDGGASFSARTRISGARWELNGCPRKPTALANQGDRWAAAYYSAAEDPAGAYVVASADGANWGAPLPLHAGALLSDAPMLTFAGERLVAVWQARVDADTRETHIFYASSADGGHRFDVPRALSSGAGQARQPTVAAFKDGSVYVVWQQEGAIVGRRIEPR
jgi:hypothetical protein